MGQWKRSERVKRQTNQCWKSRTIAVQKISWSNITVIHYRCETVYGCWTSQCMLRNFSLLLSESAFVHARQRRKRQKTKVRKNDKQNAFLLRLIKLELTIRYMYMQIIIRCLIHICYLEYGRHIFCQVESWSGFIIRFIYRFV